MLFCVLLLLRETVQRDLEFVDVVTEDAVCGQVGFYQSALLSGAGFEAEQPLGGKLGFVNDIR